MHPIDFAQYNRAGLTEKWWDDNNNNRKERNGFCFLTIFVFSISASSYVGWARRLCPRVAGNLCSYLFLDYEHSVIKPNAKVLKNAGTHSILGFLYFCPLSSSPFALSASSRLCVGVSLFRPSQHLYENRVILHSHIRCSRTALRIRRTPNGIRLTNFNYGIAIRLAFPCLRQMDQYIFYLSTARGRMLSPLPALGSASGLLISTLMAPVNAALMV